MAKKANKFFPIAVPLYRLTVLVTWEADGNEIAKFANKNGCQVANRFPTDFKENADDALGLCMKFSNDNPDVLVWLRQKPKKASTYATLYHELYHAVDDISKSRNLADEPEARAYLFEYLADRCNQKFWPK